MQFLHDALQVNEPRTVKRLQAKIQRAHHVTLSQTTIRNMMHAQHYQWRPRRSCPKLNEQQIRARQQFSEDYNGPLLSQVRGLPMVFTDESRFCQTPDSEWSWVLRGECLKAIVCELEKFSHVSVMIWAAIGYNFKSRLIIITGTVTAEYYQTMLAGFFIECDTAFGKGGWVLVQDGAPAHNAQSTIDFLGERCNLMPFWPANSPDMNPIEALWGAIKRKIDWTMTTDPCNQMDQSKINDLVASFANRVHMVHDAKGQTIQLALSSHKTSIPDDYLRDAEAVEPKLWTKEEDDELQRHRKEDIKHVAPIFKERHDKTEVKRRLRFLKIVERNKDWTRPVIFDTGGMTEKQATERFQAEMAAFGREMQAEALATANELREETMELENIIQSVIDAPQESAETAIYSVEDKIHAFVTQTENLITDTGLYTTDLIQFAQRVNEIGKNVGNLVHDIEDLAASDPDLAPATEGIIDSITVCRNNMGGFAGALNACCDKMNEYVVCMATLLDGICESKGDCNKFGTLGLAMFQFDHLSRTFGAFMPQFDELARVILAFVTHLSRFADQIQTYGPAIQEVANVLDTMAADAAYHSTEAKKCAVYLSDFAREMVRFAAFIANIGEGIPLF
jgi:hypothetical protein